jgi:hypothetical protein
MQCLCVEKEIKATKKYFLNGSMELRRQGDQIGRIFYHRAVVYIDQFLDNYKSIATF